MKPQHSVNTRLKRCPCCQSKKSSHNAGGKKYGNSSARGALKRDLFKRLSD